MITSMLGIGVCVHQLLYCEINTNCQHEQSVNISRLNFNLQLLCEENHFSILYFSQ